jgi:uncharacterized membrane protein YhaH (DUF805 family)
MNWYLKVLKQYADFNGRARRQELWMFILFNLIFSIVINIIDKFATVPMMGFGLIGVLYSLFILIPSLAVWVRRLHDINKSGWMILVGLIPLVGAIWLIVLGATDGTPGENEYGKNPKEEVAA